MHLHKSILFDFDIDLRVKITRNVDQYPLHYVTYAPAKFEVGTVEKEMYLREIHYLTFGLDL